MHTELGSIPTNPEDIRVGGKEARISASPSLRWEQLMELDKVTEGGPILAKEGDRGEGGGAP